MFEISVEYFDGRVEKKTVSSKRQAEKFVNNLGYDYWNAEIWIGNGKISVEWGERWRFGW